MNEQFEFLTLTQIQRSTDHRKIRVYADGVYDLFHYGHVEQLKQAKYSFKNIYLVVGVINDEDVIQYKGRPAVMTYEERLRSVSLCSFVDEVLTNPPFYPTIKFINQNQIDLVAHDSLPYRINSLKSNIQDCYSPFKEADRFLATLRAPAVSTTDLIDRIVANLDTYNRKETRFG